MKFKRVPIWRDAMRLLIEVETVVKHFPRYHKYTLGTEIRQQAFKIVRLIQSAFLDKPNIKAYLGRLVFMVDDFKLQLFLAKELKVYQNFAEFERLAGLARSIGKQASGWKLAVGSNVGSEKFT